MATGIATLVVRLGAETSQFDRKMKGAQGTLKRVTTAAAEAVASMIKMGPAMAGATATAFFAKAVHSGEAFNREMKTSLAIMGEVSDVMRNDMRQAAQDVAATTVFSMTEVAKTYFDLASAGMKAKETLEALPVAAKFAQAGNFDMSKATMLLTRAHGALGLRTDDTAENLKTLTHLGNLLIKTNILTTTSVEEVSEALAGPFAGALRASKRPLEEGIALLALLASRGAPGKEGGQMGMVLLRDMPRAVANNEAAFEKYGIVLRGTDDNLVSINEQIMRTTAGLGKLGEIERAAAMDAMGLTRSLGNVIKTLLAGEGDMQNFSKELQNVDGVMDTVADRMTPIQAGWKKVTAAITGAGAELTQLSGSDIGTVLGLWGTGVSTLTKTFVVLKTELAFVAEAILANFPKLKFVHDTLKGITILLDMLADTPAPKAASTGSQVLPAPGAGGAGPAAAINDTAAATEKLAAATSKLASLREQLSTFGLDWADTERHRIGLMFEAGQLTERQFSETWRLIGAIETLKQKEMDAAEAKVEAEKKVAIAIAARNKLDAEVKGIIQANLTPMEKYLQTTERLGVLAKQNRYSPAQVVAFAKQAGITPEQVRAMKFQKELGPEHLRRAQAAALSTLTSARGGDGATTPLGPAAAEKGSLAAYRSALAHQREKRNAGEKNQERENAKNLAAIAQSTQEIAEKESPPLESIPVS